MLSKTGKEYFLSITVILFLLCCLLPSGIHLKLCFGEDGHFDFSAKICASKQPLPPVTDSHPQPEDHHGDCSDFTLSCGNNPACRADSFLLPANSSSLFKNFDILNSILYSGVLPQEPVKSYRSEVFISEKCNYHPPHLSSVILLI